MKLIKISLGLIVFCCFHNSYAMKNDKSIKEILNMRDQLVIARTIIESRNRVRQMPIFKSVEDLKIYNEHESNAALYAITQVYDSYLLFARDNVMPEHQQAANGLLHEAIEMREKIHSDLDL